MDLIYIALFLLTTFLLAILERERRNKSRKLPPGPWGLPIVGYLPWLDPKEPHESLTSLTKKYGRVCALRMGSVYTVLISDPRIVRQAFAKSAISGRAPLHLTHGIMQGYGLICAEGDHWKEQRKFVTTCLKNFGMVKYGDRRDKMESDITTFVDQAINALKKESVDGAIDASKILHHYLGNFMNNLVFGKVYEEDDETWKWLRHIQEEGVKYLGIAGPLNFLPFLRFIPRFNKVTRILVDGQSKTHREYARMIEQHRAYKNSREGTQAENFLKSFDDEVSKRRLIGDLGSFTERQYHFLLADLFGAGVDTTFTSLRWFLLYMAVHPQEQEKIHREMDEVLGNRAPKLEDRSQLLYLEASILEVQRIRSVVPVGIPHGTTEDTTIGDFDIPKGTMVVPLQWAIHMDPEYWDDPNTFKPERFIAEDGNLLKPEAFLPFQNGKRMCPGDELAKMLLFIFAGRILFSFTISAPPEGVSLVGDCGITLVPKPHRLVFVPRQS